MRSLVVLVLLVLGACMDQGATPIPPDGGIVPDAPLPPPPECDEPGTGCVPVGAACDARTHEWCAGGEGWCSAGTCRAWCSPVAYPRCDKGTIESHETIDGSDVCVCVPSAE